MKYTNSPVAFLCFFLGVALTSFIPIVSADDDDPFESCAADYVPQKPIDNFQLKTVGVSDLDANQDQDDKPSPVRVYLNKVGMTVHLFYEGHPEHVLDTNLVDVTLYAASDASGVSRRRMDDRKVKFDSVSPTAGITSSFKGEDDVLKRRLDSGAEDCTPCDCTTVIEVNGSDFQKMVTRSINIANKNDDDIIYEDYCPIGCWDTSKVMDMSYAFFRQSSFDKSINCWNVASVTNMKNMFQEATDFNQPLKNWNVARVTNMYNMFYKAPNFNQALNDWNVSRVNIMNSMFYAATNFNQQINDWDVANVANIGGMFWKANTFNQPLDDWNLASVNYMDLMFNQAYAFNQPLDDWNMPSVNSMRQVFSQATNFNQCLSTWADKTPPDIDVTTIFDGTSCPNTSDPDPSVGPWCQDQCSAPSTFSSPCGENGVALPSTLYGVTLVSYNDDNYNGFFTQLDASQCFPRTTNGVVAQAEIVMTENPLDLDSNLASLIYDGSLGTNGGQLKFCARIAYSIGDDGDKELSSYIDTKVVLDVILAADIEFTQVVDISSDQTPVTSVNQDVSTVIIDVDSFLCGDPGENDGAPYGDAYSLGQSFRVCVDVKAADEDNFRLTNFGEVKCSTDSGLESIIISLVNDVATAASIWTTLFDNGATAGAKSVASGTPSTQIEASERAISFSTVVTNVYLTGDDNTLTCVGSVDVDTVTQRRQLVSFTVPNPVSSSLSSGRRQMEEDTGTIAGAVEFGATIKLSPSSAASGRLSSLPMMTDDIVGFLLVIGVGPMMMMMMMMMMMW